MGFDQFKGQPRLPQFAVPKRYDIKLKPDLVACKFAGDVSIDVDIVSPTKFIVLNAIDLDVQSDSVSFVPQSTSTSQGLRASGVGFVQEDEILVLEFAEELPMGLGFLKIAFQGTLNDDTKMKGFYTSVYEIDGEKRNMAVTQFEATDARRCFPCWDEPAAKATFKLTLVVPDGVTALSNMPVFEEKQQGNCTTVSFEESPIMSSYLVAVVIGLFDYVEDHTDDGVKVRVYCQVGKTSQVQFALDVAVKTLELYTKYFGVPYPLPKLDMVAVPDSHGAMENYGLVTFREPFLLYDESHSTAANKQTVAVVVAHELAHQWFGNLVTMEWWTHLWLNEGFATWRALASYVKRHAYSNASTEDLWAAIEEESGEPVTQLMNTWTKQQGYPVVSVKINGQKLEFEQSQFLFSGSAGDGQWIVPITLCCSSYDSHQNFLLKSKSGSIDIGESDWIKLNVETTGFYRVKYDEKLAAKLRPAIENNQLTPTDRFGVLDDAFALCTAGQLPLSSLLTLMHSFSRELDYTVQSNLIDICYKVSRIVADAAPQIVDDVEQFFTILFQYPVKLGWESKQGEGHLDAMLRGSLLAALANFGDESTIDEAIKRFNAFLEHRNSPLLPPDVRKASYVAVMRKVTKSNRSGYEALLRVYRETELSQEKGRILGSLASCPDPDIVLEALNFLLCSEVRSQDAVFGLAVCKEGRETAWKWLTFSSVEKAKEVEAFFANRSVAGISRTLKQCLEKVEINARWVESIQKDDLLEKTMQELPVGRMDYSRFPL